MAGILLLQQDPKTALHYTEVIRAVDGLEVLGSVGTLAEARDWLARQTPDLLLADLQLPDGPVAPLLGVLRGNGRVRVPELLVATPSVDDPALMEALRQGADGYFVQGRPPEALIAAIHLALAGESPMAPSIARQIKAHFESTFFDNTDFVAESQNPLHLGTSERTLLDLVAEGHVTSEIAREMERTVHGVGVDLRSMYRKLQFDVRADALTLSF
jgi:DNA-binding NarL/FixJ family response regulator